MHAGGDKTDVWRWRLPLWIVKVVLRWVWKLEEIALRECGCGVLDSDGSTEASPRELGSGAFDSVRRRFIRRLHISLKTNCEFVRREDPE